MFMWPVCPVGVSGVGVGLAGLLRLFNVIVAHEPGRWGFREALRFVKNVLPGVVVFDTPRNLLLLKVGDPFGAVRRIAESADVDSPVLRAIPLDGEVPAFVEDVVDVVRELVGLKASRLGGRPSFAVRVEGRLYSREGGGPVSSVDAVRAIAEPVDLPVNLRSPDLLVLVKVVRLSRSQRYAGVMVADPGSVFSRARLGVRG